MTKVQANGISWQALFWDKLAFFWHPARFGRVPPEQSSDPLAVVFIAKALRPAYPECYPG
jgi:hypothetical protein